MPADAFYLQIQAFPYTPTVMMADQRIGSILDAAFVHALDAVGQGVAFYSVGGAPIHQNAWLRRALDLPSGLALNRALASFVSGLRTTVAERTWEGILVERVCVRELSVGLRPARRLIGSYVGYDLFGQGSSYLVSIDTAPYALSSPDELKGRFQLTPAEARVALYLAEGLSTEELAVVLSISRHTVRRHVEKVLRKLGVESRNDVAAMLGNPET